MLVVTLSFKTSAQQSFQVANDSILLGSAQNVAAVLSNDPTLTYNSFISPPATDFVDDEFKVLLSYISNSQLLSCGVQGLTVPAGKAWVAIASPVLAGVVQLFLTEL